MTFSLYRWGKIARISKSIGCNNIYMGASFSLIYLNTSCTR